MERIKGDLGKDGIERYHKIIKKTLDKHGLCNGYGVFFEYDIKKDKTFITISKYLHGIPVKVLLYKSYCDGEPVITDATFVEEFEKNRGQFNV